MEHQDEVILSKLKEGDAQAYEILFLKYYKLLNMQAFYILDDEMEAEDLVQLLFVEIWEKELYLQINTSLKGYLQNTVKNRCLKIMDKRKTAQKKLDQYVYITTDVYEPDPQMQEESDNRVYSILKELPRQRQEAFTKVHLQDKKYKDVAEEMGLTVNSVKTHLKLAIKELRNRFINFK